MLIVALIEQQKIAGLSVVELFGYEAGVFLYKFERADVGTAFAIREAPVVAQRTLFGVECQLRRRQSADTVRALPFRIVIAQ